MPLQNIEVFIRNQVGKTNNKVFDDVLGQISSMLAQSDGGKNMESLLQALTYIGAMPTVTKGFLSDPKIVPLIAKLEQDKNINAVFDREIFAEMRSPAAHVYKPPKQPLSSDEQKILKEIYLAIRKEYKPAWIYNYSSKAFDKVLNSGWDKNADEALVDFMRNAKIEGISGNIQAAAHPELKDEDKKESAISRISELVAKADGYKDLAGSKKELERWLRDNGGQAPILGVLTYLFHTEPNFSMNPLGYLYGDVDANWIIENGKVVLSYDAVVPAVQSDTKLLAATKNGIHLVSQQDGEKWELVLKEISQLKDAKLPLPNLMQFKGKMVLEVDDKGKVAPKMMSCKVTSYSSQLTSPAHLYLSLGNDKENAPTPGPK